MSPTKPKPRTAKEQHGPERIAAALLPLAVPIASLKHHPRNARVRTQRNLDAITASLSEFGQRKPVVARKGVVVAGNGLLAVALSLGWKRLAVAPADDMTEAQAEAYALADNKSGDLSEFDFAVVADVLRGMDEHLRKLTGFADFEIEPLLQATWAPPEPTADEPGAHEPAVYFRATHEQARTIRAAIDKVRVGDASKDDGAALEVVCAAFIEA